MTDLQYMALSSIAYSDMPTDLNLVNGQPQPWTILDLIKAGKIEGAIYVEATGKVEITKPEYSDLSTALNYILISSQPNTSSGFSACAFQNPDTKEIVFAFRGTEGLMNKDGLTDGLVAFGLPTPQYSHALDYVFNTLNKYGPVCYESQRVMLDDLSYESNVSFTGHSLGGGIAQFMTYYSADIDRSDGGARSVTFDAVGIVGGPILDKAPYNGAFNSIDHVSINDIVGNYGGQVGETIYHINSNDIDYRNVDFHALNKLLYIQIQELYEVMDKIQAALEKDRIIEELSAKNNTIYTSTMKIYGAYIPDAGRRIDFYAYHGLDKLIVKNPTTGKMEMTQTVDAQTITIARQKEVLQLINALKVISTAKEEGNYSDSLLSNVAPLDSAIFDGVTYIQPIHSLSFNPEGYTYSDTSIAYANYILVSSMNDVQAAALSDPFTYFQQANALQRVDPLVLDLDNDGIETTTIEDSNTFFDLDNSGFAEKTSWVGKDDGLLVLDKNSDGIINNGNELFGDRTLLNDGITYASSGFASLAEYDKNKDNIIDKNDEVYFLLKIWQDSNSDGRSAASELKNLVDLGIVSVGLSYLNTGITDSSNNIQVRTGEFKRTNGTVGTVGEYLLNRDTVHTVDEIVADIPSNIAQLPNLYGAGNVPSLHNAMANDTTGILQSLVQSFMSETDIAAREQIMQRILVRWTGNDGISPTSRGVLYDAQKLGVMEKFFGVSFLSDPMSRAVPFLTSSYGMLFEKMYVDLLAKTHLKDTIALLDVDALGNTSFIDIQTKIDQLRATDDIQATTMLKEFARTIKNNNLADTDNFASFRAHYAQQSQDYAKAIDFAGMQVASSTAGNDTLNLDGVYNATSGGQGDDSLYANTMGSVVAYGDFGNDIISSSSGNDFISGGIGNDTLSGGAGNDTYIFYRGDGNDTITDYLGTDTIQFGTGISPADIKVSRIGADATSGEHLVLSINGTSDKITVNNFFGTNRGYEGYKPGTAYRIETVKFADGTMWNGDTILTKARTVVGTSNSETVNGFSDQANILYGYAGDDTLYIPNTRNSYLYGGSGNDTLRAVYGGNHVFDGGIGNDSTSAGSGDDVYIFRRGDGIDTITDTGGSDKIQFGDNILPSDIKVSRVGTDRYGQDLKLSIAGTTDSITVKGFFGAPAQNGNFITSDTYKIEQFVFKNGTIWNAKTILDKARYMSGTINADTLIGYSDQDNIIYGGSGDDTVVGNIKNDTLYGGNHNDIVEGMDGNDLLYGEAGNDTLRAGNGNDTLDGGLGNDTLQGSTGDDTYIFRKGDGVDVIWDEAGVDTVKFDAGILPTDIQVSRAGKDATSGEHLVLTLKDTTDKITINNFFGTNGGFEGYKPSDTYKIEQFVFSDGTTWTAKSMAEKARYISGTAAADTLIGFSDQGNYLYGSGGDDILYGNAKNDMLYGHGDNDTLSGGDGDDTLDGGTGNDYLQGSSGIDTLIGGTGNDKLEGGDGNDIYIFRKGDGSDTITDYDSTPSNVAHFTDASTLDLMFARSGDNLTVTRNGSTDTVAINSWYRYTNCQLGTMKTANGSTITNTNVDQLIQAMATFSTNNSGMSWSQAIASKPAEVQAVVSQYWAAPGA